MSYITGWIIVGIVTLGIYKLFELFVGKKERLTLIEKLGDKLDPSVLGGKLNFPIGASFMPASRVSFSSLKLGSLLLGMGIGLFVGYIVCASTIPHYFTEDGWRINEIASLIYGACVLLFGGLSLVIAFVVELIIVRKDNKSNARN